MLTLRGIVFRLGLALLFVGLAFVLIPPYAQYCEHNDNHEYACAIYEITASVIGVLNGYEPLITAVATGFIACFTITLARIGKRQIADTRILQRAYLSVEPLGIEPIAGADNQQSNAVVGIKNTGHLPATNVAWVIEIDLCGEKRWIPPPISRKREGQNVIAPGAIMPQGSEPYMFTYNDLAEIRTQFFYVWGNVTYNDGFGKTTRIDFCHRYNCANITKITVMNDRGHRITADKARQGRFGNSVNYDYRD